MRANMPRICPDDKVFLRSLTMKQVTVDACPHCAGIFFDEGEINQMRLDGDDTLAELDERVQPAEDFTIDFMALEEPPRQCPSCKHEMDKMRYLYDSPVILDSCPNCGGVWVEDGELKHMRAVLAASGAENDKVRSEAYVVHAELHEQREADINRIKRLQRAMRIFRRRAW
jgi:Zn-finger nucleic acid-binding protein